MRKKHRELKKEEEAGWVPMNYPLADYSRNSFAVRCTALDTTAQGQMDVFFGQLLYKCHLEEVASVGN